jgi:hypothetical protein
MALAPNMLCPAYQLSALGPPLPGQLDKGNRLKQQEQLTLPASQRSSFRVC